MFGAGAFAALRGLFKRRNKDDEQRRVEEMRRHDIEEERIARANSKRRYTGDGFYPRKHRRADSYTATDLSSTDMTRPPRGPLHGESAISAGAATPGPVDVPYSGAPPAPPIHQEPISEMPTPVQSRHELPEVVPGLAAGATAMDASSSHRRQRSTSRQRDDHVESPPVSVKVKMHNDGRHVTLRRLTEEEAAASREARRRERRNSRRRAGSASSLSGNEGGYDRWRRVEELERQQQEQIQREQQAAAAAAGSAAPLGAAPPPSDMLIQ